MEFKVSVNIIESSLRWYVMVATRIIEDMSNNRYWESLWDMRLMVNFLLVIMHALVMHDILIISLGI